MSRYFASKSGIYWLFFAIVIFAFLVNFSNGWRLRDDDGKTKETDLSRKKIAHRKAMLAEVQQIKSSLKLKTVDDDDDDTDFIDAGETFNEDDDDLVAYKFERVRIRRSSSGSTKGQGMGERIKPKPKKPVEVAPQESEDDGKQTRSIFNLFGLFGGGKKDEDDDDDTGKKDEEDKIEGDKEEKEESGGLFDWLRGLKEKEKEKDVEIENTSEEQSEDEKIETDGGLLGWVKDLVSSDDEEKDDEEKTKTVEIEADKKEGGLFSWFGGTTEKSDATEEKDEEKEADNDEEGVLDWLSNLVFSKEDDSNDDEAVDEKEDSKDEGGILDWVKGLVEKDDGPIEESEEKPEIDDDKTDDNMLINLVNILLTKIGYGDEEDEIEPAPIKVKIEEDDEDTSDEKLLKKKPDIPVALPSMKKKTDVPVEEAKIVKILNQNVLESILPTPDEKEEEIDTEEKKIKSPIEGPSKVVKQRIAISPEDFESLLVRVPSFVPNYAHVKNPDCRKEGAIFKRQLRGKKLWALQMIDASGKLTSGLLRGNANQLGDYELCTEIATKVKVPEGEPMKLKGKYCLAHVDIVAEDEELKWPVHLMQGRGFVKSSLNDPNHFIPRFTTLNWGICLPSSCTYEDAGSILEHFVKPYNSTGVKIYIEIEESNCYVKKYQTWSDVLKDNWSLVASLGFFMFFIVLTVVASLNDFGIFINIDPNKKASIDGTEQPIEGKEETEKPAEKTEQEDVNVLHQTLMCFSIKKTALQLVGMKDDSLDGKDMIGCLYGIKAIATIMLFISLRLIPMGYIPFSNRNEFTEAFNSPFSIVLRVMYLYADVFLVVSGFLASFHMMKEMAEKQRILWFRRIVGRYMRLALPLLAVLIFYSYVWEHLGSGPRWGDLVLKNANLCKRNMWTNLIFTNNWGHVEDNCAPHTYQLAVEMQLSILAPLLIIIATANPLHGIAVYGALHAISTAIRFSSVQEDRLSPILFHGMRVTQIYRTINLTLSETLHRLTPYLVGFGLGFAIRETPKPKLDLGIHLAGWVAWTITFFWCFIFPMDNAGKDFRYNPDDAAQHYAMAPLSLSLSIAWVIYYCYLVEDGFLNRFLSSKPMIFLSKLSYSMFLIQFLVFFYVAASMSNVEHFDIFSYLNRVEVGLILLGSIFVTLIYDLPMQNIKTIIFKTGVMDDMETKDEEIVLVKPVTEVGAGAVGNGVVVEEEVQEEEDVADEEEEEVEEIVKEKETIEEQIEEATKEDSGASFWDEIISDETDKITKPEEPAEEPLEEEEDEDEEEEDIEELGEEEEDLAEEVGEEEAEEEEEEEDSEIGEEEEIIRRPDSNLSSAQKWRNWNLQDD